MTGAVEFRESDHTYWRDGKKLPGVTTILKPLYGDLRFVDQDLLNWKSDLGTAVHRAIELHVADGLDYSSLDGLVCDYFDQYLIFEADTGFRPEASEVRVVSRLGYAGTLDLAGMLNRGRGILDAKCTAALSPAVALQTAAYLNGWNESRPGMQATKRWALRLYPGGYRLQEYPVSEYKQDLSAFIGLLNIHTWCAHKGAKLGEIK